MSHMGDHLLTVARWSLTGELPADDEVDAAAESGVAFPIRTEIDGALVCVGLHVREAALAAGADKPRPISEVVSSLEWDDEGRLGRRTQMISIPGNGVVVYAPTADGRDRLGILYSAERARVGFDNAPRVSVEARWASASLPASVEAIKAQRAAGTWSG